MTLVYVGTYTKHGTSEGIYVYELDPATGALRLMQTVAGVSGAWPERAHAVRRQRAR